MDLDQDVLERSYLEISRACHPDHHQNASPADQAAMLARAADVNDAYRTLRDPWERARALVELRSPGILEEAKKLDPEFLMEAMERAETVAHAGPDEREALRHDLLALVEQTLAEIERALAEGRLKDAARLLHESRYHRKALEDLEDPE